MAHIMDDEFNETLAISVNRNHNLKINIAQSLSLYYFQALHIFLVNEFADGTMEKGLDYKLHPFDSGHRTARLTST